MSESLQRVTVYAYEITLDNVTSSPSRDGERTTGAHGSSSTMMLYVSPEHAIAAAIAASFRTPALAVQANEYRASLTEAQQAKLPDGLPWNSALDNRVVMLEYVGVKQKIVRD